MQMLTGTKSKKTSQNVKKMNSQIHYGPVKNWTQRFVYIQSARGVVQLSEYKFVSLRVFVYIHIDSLQQQFFGIFLAMPKVILPLTFSQTWTSTRAMG